MIDIDIDAYPQFPRCLIATLSVPYRNTIVILSISYRKKPLVRIRITKDEEKEEHETKKEEVRKEGDNSDG